MYCMLENMVLRCCDIPYGSKSNLVFPGHISVVWYAHTDSGVSLGGKGRTPELFIFLAYSLYIGDEIPSIQDD